MKPGIRALERAFQLARSGSVKDIWGIKVALRREGYFTEEIEGPKIRKQLRDLIAAAGNLAPTSPHGISPASMGIGTGDERPIG